MMLRTVDTLLQIMAAEGIGRVRLAFDTVVAGRSTGRSWSRGGEMKVS